MSKNTPVQLYIGTAPIPERRQIRILGVHLQGNAPEDTTITQLRAKSYQLARIIKRLKNNRNGMREEDTVRIVQAMIIRRIGYSLPFQNLTKSDEEHINAIVRSCPQPTPVHL
ncbi:hypothetical protein HPB48_006521 [Haemaphysalis longicornis]|uniref:Uncharacterized protein n=1 Tax=Haemaphysalis longicornis TaxID=44386 RepID=A0A9J6GTJ2_HAELO|nr:hypothetical protein HPB48_006521 [Haemaphysalis longicornis]